MAKPTIAILGASAERQKFGNKAVRAYASKDWDVYPVNPKASEIEGLRSYPSIADVPAEHLKRVSVYLPPPATLKALDEIANKGCDELWLNPGTHDEQVAAKCQQLGLKAIFACSIVALGVSPSQFP